jgi:hypothetical protein
VSIVDVGGRDYPAQTRVKLWRDQFAIHQNGGK